MNATSAMAAPARIAIARPSAVAPGGLEVVAPEVSGSAGGHHGQRGTKVDWLPAADIGDHPADMPVRFDQIVGERVFRGMSIRGSLRSRATSARSISAPVASPPGVEHAAAAVGALAA